MKHLNVRNELLLADKPLRGLWMSTGHDVWEYNHLSKIFYVLPDNMMIKPT